MRLKISALVGGLALAATTGVLLAATSASAIKCPPPLQPGEINVRGYVTLSGCYGHIVEVPPGCDPGPCDPTAAPPQE